MYMETNKEEALVPTTQYFSMVLLIINLRVQYTVGYPFKGVSKLYSVFANFLLISNQSEWQTVHSCSLSSPFWSSILIISCDGNVNMLLIT